MMGLVGNVAEVKRLRHRLMKSEFITVFSELLSSASDGIEVRAYNYNNNCLFLLNIPHRILCIFCR